jgi:hypothetical protein
VNFKRGAYKAFRDFLNEKYPVENGNIARSYAKGERGILYPRKRAYGDYLFFQDREMFRVTLEDFSLEPEFDRKPWLK